MKLPPCQFCNEVRSLGEKGFDMVIKDLDLEPKDIIAEFCGSSRWKELSKETSSKILSYGIFMLTDVSSQLASIDRKGN
ncbi:hypothetical protein Tco_0612568 [Tanacetum coccineum]